MEPINIPQTSGCRNIDSTGEYLAVGGGHGNQTRIYNSGPNAVCVLSGTGAQLAIFPTDNATANGSGVVIPAGNTEVFTMQPGGSLHFICLAGQTATVYASRGLGE